VGGREIRHAYRRMKAPSLLLDPHDTPCPKCEGGGQAMSVGVGQSLRMVHYICATCGHEWFVAHEMSRGRVLPFRRVARD